MEKINTACFIAIVPERALHSDKQKHAGTLLYQCTSLSFYCDFFKEESDGTCAYAVKDGVFCMQQCSNEECREVALMQARFRLGR